MNCTATHARLVCKLLLVLFLSGMVNTAILAQSKSTAPGSRQGIFAWEEGDDDDRKK